MNQATWTIEYGVPTPKQAASVVCNFSILLRFDGKAIGNVSGFQVRAKAGGTSHFIAPPDTLMSNGKYLKFAGFDKITRAAIVAKALELRDCDQLLEKYSRRFELRPQALRVQNGKVESPEATVVGFAG